MIENGQSRLQPGHILIVGSGFWDGEIAKYVRSGNVSVLDRLLSYYEEADTRLLLHASHAPESMARIFVVSPDTDAAVLCVHYLQAL